MSIRYTRQQWLDLNEKATPRKRTKEERKEDAKRTTRVTAAPRSISLRKLLNHLRNGGTLAMIEAVGRFVTVQQIKIAREVLAKEGREIA